MTLVTLTNTTFTRTVIVASAVDGAIHRRPTNVTETLVHGRTGTLALLTLVVATTHRHTGHAGHTVHTGYTGHTDTLDTDTVDIQTFS